VLPDEDGLALCSMLKVTTGVPILICSGTQRRRDPYLALKLGADDFIAKPFDVYDLAARVEALLRRSHPATPSESNEARAPIRIGALRIDHASHQVTVGTVPLQLTPTEFRLLTVLASRPGQVVPRELLARQVWGDPDTGTSRTIDVHVGRLRMKLTQADGGAPRIVSVRGFGYKLVTDMPADVGPTAPPTAVAPSGSAP
jgi:two-component system, OmpR family, response regulator MtrA